MKIGEIPKYSFEEMTNPMHNIVMRDNKNKGPIYIAYRRIREFRFKIRNIK